MNLTLRRRLAELERGRAPEAVARPTPMTRAELDARLAELVALSESVTPEERLEDVRTLLSAPWPNDPIGQRIHEILLDGAPAELSKLEVELGMPGLSARELDRFKI